MAELWTPQPRVHATVYFKDRVSNNMLDRGAEEYDCDEVIWSNGRVAILYGGQAYSYINADSVQAVVVVPNEAVPA